MNNSNKASGSTTTTEGMFFTLKPMKTLNAVYKIYSPSEIKPADVKIKSADVSAVKLLGALLRKDENALINRSGFYTKGVAWYDNAKTMRTTQGRNSKVVPVKLILDWVSEGNTLEWAWYKKTNLQLKQTSVLRNKSTNNEPSKCLQITDFS